MRVLNSGTLFLRFGWLGLLLASRPALADDQLPQTTTGDALVIGQETDARRTRLLSEAQVAHGNENHELALELAQQALALRESSAVLRFVAEQNWLLSRPSLAREQALRCLERAAEEASSDNRVAVERGCQFIVDQTNPPTPDSPKPPGSKSLQDAQSIAGQAARRRPESLEPEQRDRFATDAALQREVPKAPARRVWTTIAVGGGASALVAAAILYGVGTMRHDEMAMLCGSAAGCPADAESVHSRVNRLDWIAASLAGAGLLAVGTGATIALGFSAAGRSTGEAALQVRGNF